MNQDLLQDSINEEVKQLTSSLKVKADESGIPEEERKRRVKKLAGAISHSLRATGEISVRCFGHLSISKGAKAIAISQKFIQVQNLQLSCSPGFITTVIGGNELTGICFATFTTDKDTEIDVENCKNILRVAADPRDIEAEDRKRKVKSLAAAISHGLEEDKEVFVRCFGSAAIGKAAKALAIARGLTAMRGPDLYCWPVFIMADIAGKERTGIGFYTYTNET